MSKGIRFTDEDGSTVTFSTSIIDGDALVKIGSEPLVRMEPRQIAALLDFLGELAPPHAADEKWAGYWAGYIEAVTT